MFTIFKKNWGVCEVKKKIFIPLVVFLIGTCLAGLIVYKTNLLQKENKLTITQLNATTYDYFLLGTL